MASIRVVLVEDDQQLLKEMEALLAATPVLEVVGSYPTGREAVTGILAGGPEVALIDLELPDISGVEVIQQVRANGEATECLVLTVYDDDTHLFAALRAGAVGYIVKSEASLAELVQAIQDVRSGGAPMSMGLARRILQAFQTSPAPQVQGLTKKTQLYLSEYSNKQYISNDLKNVIIQDLNNIIYNKEIYDENRFLSIKLRRETEDLIQRKLHGEDLVVLNRMLLEDAYPNIIKKSNLLSRPKSQSKIYCTVYIQPRQS